MKVCGGRPMWGCLVKCLVGVGNFVKCVVWWLIWVGFVVWLCEGL